MAKVPVKVNKSGEEIKEYPKLVKTEKGKVLVQNAEEEAALSKPPKEENKPAGWNK